MSVDHPTEKYPRGAITPAEVRQSIHLICHELNYEPFRELIKIATGTKNVLVNGEVLEVPLADVDQRITIAKEIAGYLAPKLKNIEVKQEFSGGINVIVERHGDSSNTQSPLSPGQADKLIEDAAKVIDIVEESNDD